MLVRETAVRMASDLFEGAAMTRAKITEYLLRMNGQGQIVSQLGPCVCGAPKREWHPVCLKETSDGTR